MGHRGNNNSILARIPGGGLIIFVIFITGFLLVNPSEIPAFHLLMGLMFVYIVGVIDDLRDLDLGKKVILQLVAITYLSFFGIRISFMTNPVDGFIYFNLASIPVTVIWIFVLVNMVNLLEELEGLSVGISIMSSFFILLIARDLGRDLTADLVLILFLGLILIKIANEYFERNLRMGNSGSMLVGSILAIISVSGAVKSMALFSLLLPLIIMGVPLLNGIFALGNILFYKNSSGQFKNKLLHHLFLDWGLTEQQSRYSFYVLSLIFGLLGLVLVNVTTTQSLIIITTVLIVMGIIFQELSRGNLGHERLKNVKLLKDIQLDLYQIRDIVHYKKVNGELEMIRNELSQLRRVISVKIPDYLQKAVEETSVNRDQIAEEGTAAQLESIITVIDEIMETYSLERENLNYILEDYSDELEEIVKILDDIYRKIK